MDEIIYWFWVGFLRGIIFFVIPMMVGFYLAQGL